MYGVLPWHPDVWLDSEDALDLEGRRALDGRRALQVAVVRLPRISNFTDVDALGLEPGARRRLRVRPARRSPTPTWSCSRAPARPSPISAWLRARGLDRGHRPRTRPPGGRCSASAAASRCSAAPSPTRTASRGRRRRGRRARPARRTHRVHGREGAALSTSRPATRSTTAGSPASSGAGAVFGTMVHGCLEDDATRADYLAEALGVRLPASFPAARERRLDLLATWSRSTSTSRRCSPGRDGAPSHPSAAQGRR